VITLIGIFDEVMASKFFYHLYDFQGSDFCNFFCISQITFYIFWFQLIEWGNLWNLWRKQCRASEAKTGE
jgi:hypothetical protein